MVVTPLCLFVPEFTVEKTNHFFTDFIGPFELNPVSRIFQEDDLAQAREGGNHRVEDRSIDECGIFATTHEGGWLLNDFGADIGQSRPIGVHVTVPVQAAAKTGMAKCLSEHIKVG